MRFAHRILEQGTCERGMGNWKLDYTLQKDAEGELVRYSQLPYISLLFEVFRLLRVFA